MCPQGQDGYDQKAPARAVLLVLCFGVVAVVVSCTSQASECTIVQILQQHLKDKVNFSTTIIIVVKNMSVSGRDERRRRARKFVFRTNEMMFKNDNLSWIVFLCHSSRVRVSGFG